MLFENSGMPGTAGAFIKCELNSVVREFINWMTEVLPGVVWAIDTLDEPQGLSQSLKTLYPLRRVLPSKEYFADIGDGWTLATNNFEIGPDVVGLSHVLSKRLRARAIRVLHFDRNDNYYPGTAFALIEAGEKTRSIHCLNDGGKWRFETFGAVQDFEDISTYQERILRKRFTKEKLISYCEKLDVPSGIFSESAMISRSVVCTRNFPKEPA